MPQETNPYESPQTTDKIPDERSSEWKNILVRWFPRIFNLRGGMLVVWWTIIFAANLIIPGLIASDVAHGYSQFGIQSSCFVLFLAGIYICKIARPYGRAIVLGGTVIAVMQFLPIVQLIAGAIAYFLLSAVGIIEPQPNRVPRLTQFSDGFFLTFMTGLELMFVSLVIGLLGSGRTQQRQ